MSGSEILKAGRRTKLGSRPSRQLRREGRIPASIQPHDDKPHLDVHIGEHDFLAARRHHVHLFDLDVEGTVETAVVHELQWDTFGERLLHIEFKRVERGVKTEAEVEVAFRGHPKSGVINHILDHVTISCLPSQIPDEIEHKVDSLSEGSSIHAGDLELPEGMDLAMDAKTVIATITGVRGDAEDEPSGEGDDLAADGDAAPAAPSEG